MTCGTCRHFTLSMPTTRFGSCAANAWQRSWTDGIGFGFSPSPHYERRCDAWKNLSME